MSLFAQELKTPYPVSVKRLMKEWEALKLNGYNFKQPETILGNFIMNITQKLCDILKSHSGGALMY